MAQSFQLHGATVSTTTLRHLFELLWSTPSKKLFKSAEHESEKYISVAASKKCYLISTGPNVFISYIQLSCKKIFI